MLNRLLDLLFPATTCALCQQPGAYSTQRPWCDACAHELVNLQTKYRHCSYCGRFVLTHDDVCSDCREQPFPVVARAALPYEGQGISAIHSLKFGRDQRLADAMSEIMYAVVQQENAAFAACEIIVPVPLSPDRLKKRGFNQSQRLAQALAQRWQLPCQPHSLFMKRAVPMQHALPKSQRAQNLLSALQVRTADISNRRVLLVDDIMTTGSTLMACSQALMQGGAQSVTCLCWSAGINKI